MSFNLHKQKWVKTNKISSLLRDFVAGNIIKLPDTQTTLESQRCKIPKYMGPKRSGKKILCFLYVASIYLAKKYKKLSMDSYITTWS